MEKIPEPMFANAFMGYNKKAVENYISRLVSEVEIAELRTEKTEKELAEAKLLNERLRNQLDAVQSETEGLYEKTRQLNDYIRGMEAQMEEQHENLLRANTKIEKMQNDAKESGLDPQAIQDAILSAQRMGNLIVDEANQKAEAIRAQAQTDFDQTQQDIRNQLNIANGKVEQIVADGEQKRYALQQEYDKILMDVSGFKAEMISLYRKHLEMLYKLPDDGSVSVPALEEITMVDSAD